ncbi:hypothetical protein [Amycolatopsis nigrescens]|uniref:hypothetical protein n=1 Tax=Amycolatopsis nigrescens TaxID=381445 RepID=UPI000372D937|nr:hypothetical protein [Amycolatopsis nigrescens]
MGTVDEPADAIRLIEAALEAARVGATDTARVLDALAALRGVRDELAAWEPELITAARAEGVSWAVLAPALGVASRQAAERRYLRLQPSVTGETTGEGRVRAERDKRAGDRAVASWARENSASLRQLAGQVSALDGLGATAQEHAERVQRALGDNDAATLLAPLADAHPHIAEHHHALAARLTTVAEQAGRLRRDAADTRRARDQ